MDDMNLFFSDNNEIIIDALIHKLKAKIDQFEELVDHYNEERSFRIELEGQVAELKKAAKAPKVEAPATKKKGGRPKKVAVAPVKRGRGRPKKAVA